MATRTARQNGRSRFGVLGIAGFALLWVMTVPHAQQIWVAVHGPGNASGPEPLTLEIGNQAWHGYGGVASASTIDPQRVRLLGTNSCREYAEFIAPINTYWVVRFAEDGSVSVEDWTARGMEAGPALSSAPLTNCPDQPVFIPPSATAGIDLGLAPVLVAGLVALGVGVLAIRHLRRRE